MGFSHPVTCEEIGDRGLFLGDARAARRGTTRESFTYVVTVSSAEQPLTTDFHPLTDGCGLEYEAFAAAVNTGIERYKECDSVLVQCNAGISRSAAVIATIIAVTESITFTDAVKQVQCFRKRASPRTPLCDAGKRFVSEYDS